MRIKKIFRHSYVSALFVIGLAIPCFYPFAFCFLFVIVLLYLMYGYCTESEKLLFEQHMDIIPGSLPFCWDRIFLY